MAEGEVQPNRQTSGLPWKWLLIAGGGVLVLIFVLKNKSSSSSSTTASSQPGDNTALTGMGFGQPITEFDLLNAIQDLSLAINNLKVPGSSTVSGTTPGGFGSPPFPSGLPMGSNIFRTGPIQDTGKLAGTTAVAPISAGSPSPWNSGNLVPSTATRITGT